MPAISMTVPLVTRLVTVVIIKMIALITYIDYKDKAKHWFYFYLQTGM